LNGWTERDQPAGGSMLAVAPVSTPSSSFDKMRGFQPVALAALAPGPDAVSPPETATWIAEL
jgi:hypothetical protein